MVEWEVLPFSAQSRIESFVAGRWRIAPVHSMTPETQESTKDQ
jgi:hypothetical protein